ncbi:hypothetical protein BCR42DRAFT_244522 [Absidia repens]|uniref:Uncharacterized protein n=1 Tax=Absidia repens TaxID=90262 RepID=A0A1X2IKF6_9FUNG|nr:hypothetical protein BCR42DRAFT_244522 [Absidia repens]
MLLFLTACLTYHMIEKNQSNFFFNSLFFLLFLHLTICHHIYFISVNQVRPWTCFF